MCDPRVLGNPSHAGWNLSNDWNCRKMNWTRSGTSWERGDQLTLQNQLGSRHSNLKFHLISRLLLTKTKLTALYCHFSAIYKHLEHLDLSYYYPIQSFHARTDCQDLAKGFGFAGQLKSLRLVFAQRSPLPEELPGMLASKGQDFASLDWFLDTKYSYANQLEGRSKDWIKYNHKEWILNIWRKWNWLILTPYCLVRFVVLFG